MDSDIGCLALGTFYQSRWGQVLQGVAAMDGRRWLPPPPRRHDGKKVAGGGISTSRNGKILAEWFARLADADDDDDA
jgi:hypothetical protein